MLQEHGDFFTVHNVMKLPGWIVLLNIPAESDITGAWPFSRVLLACNYMHMFLLYKHLRSVLLISHMTQMELC